MSDLVAEGIAETKDHLSCDDGEMVMTVENLPLEKVNRIYSFSNYFQCDDNKLIQKQNIWQQLGKKVQPLMRHVLSGINNN